jgi:hypothetical protein
VPRPNEVAHAVSSLCPVPLAALRRRGPARTAYLRAARVPCDAKLGEIAAPAGCRVAAVRRTVARLDEDVRRVERVVHGPRFWGLLDGDLPARWLRRRSG